MDIIKQTPQIEADRRLIVFKNYDEYLNSLTTVQDHCYLQSPAIARYIAELGYRSSGETLTKEQFERRLATVKNYLHPKFLPYISTSDNVRCKDRLLQELALRERSNRLGMLATIIFLRYFNKQGKEVSGYIDYADRLTEEDWRPIFNERKKIQPKPTDLGYYDWKLEKTACNDSKNFKVITSPKRGLLFQNRYDRQIINVDPSSLPGSKTTRCHVASNLYENVVLYDHSIMQRI